MSVPLLKVFRDYHAETLQDAYDEWRHRMIKLYPHMRVVGTHFDTHYAGNNMLYLAVFWEPATCA